MVSSEQMLVRVWDEHADPFSQAVKTTMSRLRAKLGRSAAIQTVARSGYRIAECPQYLPTTDPAPALPAGHRPRTPDPVVRRCLPRVRRRPVSGHLCAGRAVTAVGQVGSGVGDARQRGIGRSDVKAQLVEQQRSTDLHQLLVGCGSPSR